MTETLLPTTVVGSYPQPDWLIDRERLTHLPPVRVRAQELWRVSEPWLEQAQDDATRLAIRDMEQAGIDIITDGEIRRESYSNRFATALSGVDLDNPATVRGRSSGTVVVPRIVGPIRRLRPVEDYLGPQRRFAHLFSPKRRDDVIAKIQEAADRNIARFGLVEEEAVV